MKVYVLEVGCYDGELLYGVYATPELAMSAWSPTPGAVRGSEYGKMAGVPWEYEWEKGSDRFVFLADWDDAATITEHEVIEA